MVFGAGFIEYGTYYAASLSEEEREEERIKEDFLDGFVA
jgi:hypothetical protein